MLCRESPTNHSKAVLLFQKMKSWTTYCYDENDYFDKGELMKAIFLIVAIAGMTG